MKAARISMILMAAATAYGCAATHNMTAKEVRTKDYFQNTEELAVETDEVYENLATYEVTCRVLNGTYHQVSENPAKVIFVATVPGLTKRSTVAVIEFSEKATGTTRADVWMYFTAGMWPNRISEILHAATNPNQCI